MSVLQGDVCFFNDNLGKNTANHVAHQERVRRRMGEEREAYQWV